MRCAVFYFYPMEYVIRKQTSENRNQKTESRYQRTDARRQKTGNRNQTPENRNQKSEIRTQRTDNRNREQKSEDRKRISEIRNQISRLWAVICLRVSDPRLPAVFLFPRTEAFRNMLGNDPLCVFCPCIER